MRNEIVFFLNGERVSLSGEVTTLMLSDWLRYERGLPGTKVVCAEGDCGACTLLVSRYRKGALGEYRTINSCIAPMYTLDRSHVITVEGLKRDGVLHPVQEAMVRAQGSQCGYCTPGFVCSLAGMVDRVKQTGGGIDAKRVRNHTTGNLCRCTGYEPILQAGCSIDPGRVPGLSSLFDQQVMIREFQSLEDSVQVGTREHPVFVPLHWVEALRLRREFPEARLVSGMTDLGVLINKGKLAPGPRIALHQVIELQEWSVLDSEIRIGARVSLAETEKLLALDYPEMSRLLRIFASPQIKHSATLAGNLMNASPIGDTTPFLRVAEARVVLARLGDTGSVEMREVGIDRFIKGGYKELDFGKDEILMEIRIPKSTSTFALFKTSTRKDLDISTVAFAARYQIRDGVLEGVRLALGGVAASVIRMPDEEAMLEGQPADPGLFVRVADSAQARVAPLSDVRGSSAFRKVLVRNLFLKFGDRVLAESGIPLKEASI
jgi:xanthine dehydrogenase small subunit